MQFSPNYPPKNRKESKLGPIEIQLEHAGGIETVDPNNLIMLFATSSGLERVDAMLPLPDVVSVLSGKSAVIYRTDNWELPLTIDEIAALAGTELSPEEFIALRDRYGIGFELHDDFYNEISGEAFQPKGLRDEYRAHLTAIGAGLEPTAARGIYLTPKP